MYHKYLNCQAGRVKANPAPLPGPARLRLAAGRGPSLVVRDGAVVEAPAIVRADDPVPVDARTRHRRPTGGIEVSVVQDPEVGAARSEEHTSELQSLMRISYAVFCLKKKKKQKTNRQVT